MVLFCPNGWSLHRGHRKGMVDNLVHDATKKEAHWLEEHVVFGQLWLVIIRIYMGDEGRGFE